MSTQGAHCYRGMLKLLSRCLGCTIPLLLGGCDLAVLSPAGPIARGDNIVLIDSVAIMLLIVVPTILAILLFAWWFRSSNSRAQYRPNFDYSGRLELITWSIPALVVFFLGGVAWISAHTLDPARPLPGKTAPLEVEVVSLDWKWLFIYPKQSVASVNRLVVPAGVPLHLRLTSASVFNVFFVPQLSSEIYAMYGMTTEINLQADHPGTFFGLAAHFNGDGFPDMSFNVDAVDGNQFAQWVDQARGSSSVLDDAGYRALLKQSANVTPYTYGGVHAGLFDEIARGQLPPGLGPLGSSAGTAEDVH
jgi:cytochrome o ubiquinol oxidase subunit II